MKSKFLTEKCVVCGFIVADGIVCDKECKGGCWDMGNTNCLGCQHFLYNGACIATCDTSLSRYTTDGVNCTDCDEQCIHGCHGPVSAIYNALLSVNYYKLCSYL